MSDSSVSDHRKEVQDYLESCEYLLAATASSDNLPLSKEERSIIAHYAVEILTAITRPTTRS
jgi:hypothetical protein